MTTTVTELLELLTIARDSLPHSPALGRIDVAIADLTKQLSLSPNQRIDAVLNIIDANSLRGVISPSIIGLPLIM